MVGVWWVLKCLFISVIGYLSIEIEEVSVVMVSRRKNIMVKICFSKFKLLNIKGNMVKIKVLEFSKELFCV